MIFVLLFMTYFTSVTGSRLIHLTKTDANPFFLMAE